LTASTGINKAAVPVQIGDWGRQGTLNQTEVGALMGELAFKRAPEFVISTGDNFYLRARLN